MRQVVMAAVLAGIVSAGAAVSGADALPLETKTCGQDVFASFRLEDDLFGCPNHGLVVKASNITIDLNGKTLTREGACCTTLGNGIHNAGFDNVIVKNGHLRGFTNGVHFADADGGRIAGLEIHVSGNGIKVSGGSSKTVIKRNEVNNSDFAGISVVESATDAPVRTLIAANTLSENARGLELIGGFRDSITGNTIASSQGLGAYIGDVAELTFADNTVDGNGGGGIVLDEAYQTRVIDNTVTRNAYSVANSAGVALEDSGGVLVRGNRVLDNEGHGISLTRSIVNRVERNKASTNHYSGIAILASSNDNRVAENVTNSNHFAGIVIDTASGNKILENTANGNDINGIEAHSVAKIADNIAKRNGFGDAGGDDGIGLGITAPDGSKGSRNIARGNDDDRQCVPAYLCR